jgi:hypothetical protein
VTPTERAALALVLADVATMKFGTSVGSHDGFPVMFSNISGWLLSFGLAFYLFITAIKRWWDKSDRKEQHRER